MLGVLPAPWPRVLRWPSHRVQVVRRAFGDVTSIFLDFRGKAKFYCSTWFDTLGLATESFWPMMSMDDADLEGIDVYDFGQVR